MKWYLLSISLMVYPIVELSRLIFVYYFSIDSHPRFIIEFTLMWLFWLIGIIIIAKHWR